MIVENPDALKLWLTTKLGPLCDADPAALAKYVFALVKKDRPNGELRGTMVQQLEVFLQKETSNFVDMLFATLNSKSYLPAADIKPKVEELTTQPPAAVAAAPVANHSEVNGVVKVKEELVKRKSESEKDEAAAATTRRRIRHRSPTPPPRVMRSRSRSRSWERNRRSRSRERGGRSRPRKPSPMTRRRERRSSWSKSPVRNRSRSRSPAPRHRRYRSSSRTPPHEAKKGTPNSGGATPTQDSNHGDVDMRLTTTSQSIQSVVSAPEHSTAAASTSTLPAYKRRCRDFDEKGYCMRGDLCPYDHGSDPVVLEDMTLGPLAFSTTTAPPPPLVPVIPGAVVPSRPPPLVAAMHHQDQGPRMAGGRHLRSGTEYSPDAPGMGRGWFRPGFRGQPGRGGARGARQPPMYNAPQRELISVPVSDNAVAPDQEFADTQNDYTQDGAPPAKRPQLASVASIPQTFDFSRLGPRKGNPANCSLELKKVPRGLNNITHLNNHFSRFGKIVNIQVSYEGDPEAAIVTFSSHAEANAAYRSTEAVLNNRFIKVFWHNKKQEGKQENVPPAMRMNIRDRLGHSSKVLNLVQPKVDPSQISDEPIVEEKVIMSGNNLTKTVYIPTALKKPDPALQENSKALATAAILKSQEILAAKETLKKKQEEKRKEALKLTANLRKRKQELLEMQLSQQKLLIKRLEQGKAGLKPAEQKTLMDTIKGLQESIETIRKDLAPQQPAQPAPRKTKEEALKEILDAELDLFTRQQEGRESLELKQKVAELKLEAHSLGLLSSQRGRGAARARGVIRGGIFRTRSIPRGRGRGRGAHTSLDHRPTRLLVSGYESEDWEDVLAHFAQFGEIADYTADKQTPALDLVYKTRKDAEAALLQGRNFRDRVLSVTWSQGLVSSGVAAVTPVGTSTPKPQASSALEQHELDAELDDFMDETELIYEDEEELGEEEEELEERSWRR